MTKQKEAAASDEQFVVVDKEGDVEATPTEEESPGADGSNVNDEAPMEIPPEIIMKGLSILSPRQKKNTSASRSHHSSVAVQELSIPLPPLRPDEPVASIRNAIMEVIGFAHLTKYRLVIERLRDSSDAGAATASSSTAASGKKKKNGSNNNKNSNGSANGQQQKEWEKDKIVSTYTLEGAVMATDRLVKTLQLGRAPDVGNVETKEEEGEEEVELNDFGDLSIMYDILEKEGIVGGDNDPPIQNNKIILDASAFAFRVVLEKYDAASIRDHMVRTRQLLEGNAPHLTTLTSGHELDDLVMQEEEGVKGEDAETAAAVAEKKDGVEKEDGQNGESNKEKEKQALELPDFPPEYDVSFSEHIQSGDLSAFYYLACGQEQQLLSLKGKNTATERQNGSINSSNNDSWMDSNNDPNGKEHKKSKNKKKSKGNKKKGGTTADLNGASLQMKNQPSFFDAERKLYELNEATCVQCTLRHSGYHPPPANRRTLGDLAYIECTLPDGNSVHITAFSLGFYVNRSTSSTFNPSPAKDACYSHTLLDCLLQHSKSLREEWMIAQTASKNRAQLIRETAVGEDAITSLLRSAVSVFPNNNSGLGIGGTMSSAPSTFTPRIDSIVQTPSWLIPLPSSNDGTWQHDKMHHSNTNRTEEDLMSTHGVETRLGGMRDWNEEIQACRELPTDTLFERMERAKMMHKVMSEFGDAALQGVKAIYDGFISPMNVQEPERSHVFLHNNIFFSRAIDVGVDTFKTYKGDNAAKKSASRDTTNINLLHRLDLPGLHTLGMVIVEYMGVRYVCQSVLQGILQGEKSHTLVYGTIDARLSLRHDDEVHKLAEDIFGEVCMVATRTVPATAHNDERMDELKNSPLHPIQMQEEKKEGEDEVEDRKKTVEFCGPIEMKAIIGSDKRKYVLDCTRLTPRDANWVGKQDGGTGFLDSDAKKHKHIPNTLDDDDWVTCVLRPELVNSYAEMKVSKHIHKLVKEDEEARKREDAAKGDDPSADNKAESKEKKLAETRAKFEQAEKEYIKTLKYNINVFLPDMRSIEDLDKEAHAQLLKDEEEARTMARYLWETVIPNLNAEIRHGSEHNLTIPVDGNALTEFIHQNGINCRYLGRLAELAMAEEKKDAALEEGGKRGTALVPRQRMPLCWLELLECEMVARAAKHVLNSYMIEQGGSYGVPCAKLIAAFLSAIVSTGEESASETELRMSRSDHSHGTLNEEDMNALIVMLDGDSDTADQKGRSEIWSDIEREVGRRFRYTLSFYGKTQSNESKSRALYLPLLRRICQRSGIRLIGRRYDLGGKCLIGGNGRLGVSYPIAPTDIVDILPLVKHGASMGGNSFVPCSFDGSAGNHSLHVLLNDVRMIYDAAHSRLSQGTDLQIAVEFLNEASVLSQRVLDTTLHPQVYKYHKLIATAYANSKNLDLALATAEKNLTMAVSLYGFDSQQTYNAHVAIAEVYFSLGRIADGIRHYRAVQFLGEALSGPNHLLSPIYFNIGRKYVDVGRNEDALRFYEVAAKKTNHDRIIDAIISRQCAMVLARLERYKEAFDCEKKTFQVYSLIYGEDDKTAKESANLMKQFMSLAVQQGKMQQKKDKDSAKSSAADAVASELLAAEDASTPKKSKKANRRRKS